MMHIEVEEPDKRALRAGTWAIGGLRLSCGLPLGAAVLLALLGPAAAQDAKRAQCDPGNGGITLSPGFCATIFADNLGHARHMAVAPDGTVYVNTWSGRYYGYGRTPPGGFLVALRDTAGSGHADKIVRFGSTIESGSAGGTGIALYNGALYAEADDRIVRYALKNGDIVPSQTPEVIVWGCRSAAIIRCIRSRSIRRGTSMWILARRPIPVSAGTA